MVFLSIILIISVLTTFTDLKYKKIYNHHLVIGAVLGLIAITYAVAFKHEHLIFHIVNGLAAFIVGFLLYRFALWRGGDAKLFTLYAFLMPIPAYNNIFVPSTISLFACSFVAGLIIFLPIFIKDIIINHNAITKDLFLLAKKQALFQAIMRTLFVSWVLFPVYYVARITNPVIILTILFLIFSVGYTVNKKGEEHFILIFFKKNFLLLSVGIIFGFLVRLWLSPNSLSYPVFTRYIFMLILSTTLSICIHTTFNHFKDYQERVPFAPLLFIGCVLSYTPFLIWVMQFMNFIRR